MDPGPLYWSKQQVLEGAWSPPPVKRVEKDALDRRGATPR
jgi:hypothetical protein